MNKSLLEYADVWRERLRHCQYAGEIYLSAEELKALAGEFVAEKVLLIKDEERYETVLLILAVNCAYHYYDDEGFWKHFCSLLSCENTITVQNILGCTIENRLHLLGLLRTERTGPFRYVGAILEQCGVSRRYIAPLARIIRDMRYNTGLDLILGMSLSDFQKRIEQVYCSRYLKNYLMDTAGWQFTLQVCRLIQLYEDGALTLMELKELPGFQPHFWDEFMAFFEFARTKSPAGTGPQFKPRLIFLANDNCLGLQFPSPGFVENITRPYGVAGWRYPVTRLESRELLSELYSGQITDSKGNVYRWQIRGWIPSGQPVIFDLIQGMIERDTVIQSGTYYLIAPVEYRPSCEIVRALGQVKIAGGRKYDAYIVKLVDGDRLPGYSVEQDTTREAVELSWIEPEKKRLKFSRDNYMDIFTGSLPEIHVSDFSPIKKNIMGLFYEIGGGIYRIRKELDLIRFQEEVRRRISVKGRIWLSRINRNRFLSNKYTIAELQFCLLPECFLNFQERLYDFNEEAFLSIKTLSSCSLHLEGCRPVETKARQWAIPVTISIARGIITCEEVVAAISVPVYRASLYKPGGKHVRFCCFADLEKEKIFTAKGYPGGTGQIHILGDTSDTFTVKFDRHGRAEVSTRKLLEMARTSGKQICELVIDHMGKTASTGTVLVDLPELQRKIYRGEPCDFAAEQARNLVNIINLLRRICSKPLPGQHLNRLPEFCRGIDEWIVIMMACASVFDKSIITASNEQIDWVDKIENQEIRKMLLFYRQVNTGIFTGEPPDELNSISVDILPGVKRWRDALALHLRLNTAEGIAGTLKEWTEDVMRKSGPFRSQLSKHAGGQLLSRAWRYYLEGRKKDALDHLYNLERGSETVIDLKHVLQTLLLLRLARMQAAIDLASKVQLNTDLAQVYEIIRHAISVLSGFPQSSSVENTCLKILEKLPFQDTDMQLLKNIILLSRKKSEEVIQYCYNRSDWLLLWIVVNFLEQGKDRASLASRLLRISDTIPASPEKGAIIEKLIEYSRGN